MFIDDHSQVSGHPRFEFELRIFHSNDDAVSHDVLHGLRLQSNFGNLSVEYIVSIGVDGESHLDLIGDLSDIGFVDVGLHLHSRQIVGDQEQRRSG